MGAGGEFWDAGGRSHHVGAVGDAGTRIDLVVICRTMRSGLTKSAYRRAWGPQVHKAVLASSVDLDGLVNAGDENDHQYRCKRLRDCSLSVAGVNEEVLLEKTDRLSKD